MTAFLQVLSISKIIWMQLMLSKPSMASECRTTGGFFLIGDLFDSRMICGSRVRVEFSHGRGRSTRGGGGGGGSSGGGGGGRSGRSGSGGGGRSGRSGSGGGGGRSRRGSGSRSPRSRKPFSSQDVCYECGGNWSFSLTKWIDVCS